MIKQVGDIVYQLTYKTPVKVVPPVNGFLILADVPVLIDGGTSDDATYQEFHEDLATIGLAPKDLGAVLVTHNHADHIGLASRLAADNPSLKVQVHEEEWPMVCATDEERERLRDELCNVIVSWGVPRELVGVMREKIVRALRYSGGVRREQVIPYPKGLFEVGGIKLEAIHCPGHTEGLVCLWWPERGYLFSNDQVLEDITPNPTIYINPRKNKRCGLGDYLNALGFIEKLPVKAVMPGHGDVFSDMKSIIEKIRRLASERRARLLNHIKNSEQASVSILDLTQEVWGEMDPINMFLGAREVHGFLEMFSDEGLVQIEMDGETIRFRLNDATLNNEMKNALNKKEVLLEK